MFKIWIINGVNLSQLGKREPEFYGNCTLQDIQKYTENILSDFPVNISWFTVDSEDAFVECIHRAGKESIDGLVLNPGAFSHTSLAIYDAIKCVSCITVETHLSNVYERGGIRAKLLTAKACEIIMSGLGKDAYHIACKAILSKKDSCHV